MDNKNNMAEVHGITLPISAKMSIEICNYIRNKELNKAKKMLQDIVEMKRALPIRRFNTDTPHKRGKIAAGKYPISAGTTFLKLLNSLESNAINKGLDVNHLFITFAKSDKAERRWRSGRKGRVEMKGTHVRLRVEEKKLESNKK